MLVRRFLTLLIVLIPLSAAPAQQPERRATTPWTEEQLEEHLLHHPSDPYLRYAYLQLARKNGRAKEGAERLGELTGLPDRPADGRQGIDIFRLFSGATAVRESLQLDAILRGGQNGEQPPAGKNVKVRALSGPKQKSHPWKKLLKGRAPKVSAVSEMVPESFYFVRFGSMSKMLEAMEEMSRWSGYLWSQGSQYAGNQRLGERLKRQLAIKTEPLLRPFYDQVVEEVAVVGSDLYLQDGSDVTLIFRLKQPGIFKPRMDRYLADAAKETDAKKGRGTYNGFTHDKVLIPDRSISVWSAYPSETVHVRSNSEAALKRVLDAIKGETSDGRKVTALGKTDEFTYIRTLMPLGAEEEDVFVYLSDAFIRRLVGPQLRLTEHRRTRAFHHLRLISYASLLYRTQQGGLPKSLDDLQQAGFTPGTFNQGELSAPSGGTYRLSEDGTTGVCSHHGRPGFMTPCLEIPVEEVSAAEAEMYRGFLADYNEYWRNYFDPIALRLRMAPKGYRLETIVLPLIDNSAYSELVKAFGGRQAVLSTRPLPEEVLFGLGMRFDKKGLVEAMGGDENIEEQAATGIKSLDEKINKIEFERFFKRGLGDEVHVRVWDNNPRMNDNWPAFFGSFAGEANWESISAILAATLVTPGYLAISLDEVKVVDDFLSSLDPLLIYASRHPIVRSAGAALEYYRSETPSGHPFRALTTRYGPFKFRVCWARMDDRLYITNQVYILDALGDHHKALAGKKPRRTRAFTVPAGNLRFETNPQNWKKVLPDFRLGWAEGHRDACVNNTGPLSALARALPPMEQSERERQALAMKVFGRELYCPAGGTYRLSEDGKRCECGLHGWAGSPVQPRDFAEGSSLGKVLKGTKEVSATLSFLEDGLRAVIILERDSR